MIFFTFALHIFFLLYAYLYKSYHIYLLEYRFNILIVYHWLDIV